MANQFFQVLKKDHQEVKGILGQLKESKESAVKKREELFQKLTEELVPHMKAEEKTKRGRDRERVRPQISLMRCGEPANTWEATKSDGE